MNGSPAGIPQWRSRGESRPGGPRQRDGISCQDRICYCRRGGRHVILLADGAGRETLSAQGISEILRRVGDMMADESFDYMNMDEGELRRRVGRCIRGTIRELALRYGVPDETFASTFLAVCADAAAGTWCSFHLGDGAILCRSEECRVISFPTNGFDEQETILTTCEGAFSFMKIHRAYLDRCTGFSLVSDGVWDNRMRQCPLLQFEAAAAGRMLGEGREDDCAAILLYKPKQKEGRGAAIRF